jgi:SlyX protein
VSHESRLETLEVKIAHLEHALQELSDVVYRQRQQLDAQEARYQRLLERVEAADRQPAADSQFEIPPHF